METVDHARHASPCATPALHGVRWIEPRVSLAAGEDVPISLQFRTKKLLSTFSEPQNRVVSIERNEPLASSRLRAPDHEAPIEEIDVSSAQLSNLATKHGRIEGEHICEVCGFPFGPPLSKF